MNRFKHFDQKKLLFCNVAWMQKYRGQRKNDTPIGGGSYVKEHKHAWEENNFLPRGGMLYGYVQPPGTGDALARTIHIENLGAPKSAEEISGITVIWTATNPDTGGRWIVGYYKNATVRRHCDEKLNRIRAEKSDCRLFSPDERNVDADAARCQSNVRYGANINDANFLRKVDKILGGKHSARRS